MRKGVILFAMGMDEDLCLLQVTPEGLGVDAAGWQIEAAIEQSKGVSPKTGEVLMLIVTDPNLTEGILTFGVGHGCEGVDTVRVRIAIPEEVTAVRGLTSAWGEGTFERDATDRVVAVTFEKADARAVDQALRSIDAEVCAERAFGACPSQGRAEDVVVVQQRDHDRARRLGGQAQPRRLQPAGEQLGEQL